MFSHTSSCLLHIPKNRTSCHLGTAAYMRRAHCTAFRSGIVIPNSACLSKIRSLKRSNQDQRFLKTRISHKNQFLNATFTLKDVLYDVRLLLEDGTWERFWNWFAWWQNLQSLGKINFPPGPRSSHQLLCPQSCFLPGNG